MGISDAIFDNMMTMLREIVAYDRAEFPNVKASIIKMMAVMHQTMGHLDWGVQETCTYEQSIEHCTQMFEDAWNEEHEDVN